jgi:hypothetical protein
MKNKLPIVFLVMVIGTFLSGNYGPWWAPAFFIVLASAMMRLSARQALIVGCMTLGLLYLGMSIWQNTKDQAGMLEKTGNLLGGLSLSALILITTLLGAVTGLLSGWLGSGLGRLLGKER